jgi:hypothetical protein
MALKTEIGIGTSNTGNIVQSMDYPVMAAGNNLNAILLVGNMNLNNSIIEGSIPPSGVLPIPQNRNMSSNQLRNLFSLQML